MYDLHTHSFYSDGELSPESLIIEAKKNNIDCLALTDHDTVAGLDEALSAAAKHGLRLITGIEFSCQWENHTIHMVGLNFDPLSDSIQQGVNDNIDRRTIRADGMLADLKAKGFDLEDALQQQLKHNVAPTRPHFARALVELGVVPSLKKAFKKFLVPGKPGYVSMQWPELKEVAKWIQDGGGVAVLAHPARYGFTRTKLLRLVDDMMAVGVHALEVSTATTQAQQAAMLADIARQKNLSASQGSDFHALDQPWAQLGSMPLIPKDLTPVWDQF